MAKNVFIDFGRLPSGVQEIIRSMAKISEDAAISACKSNPAWSVAIVKRETGPAPARRFLREAVMGTGAVKSLEGLDVEENILAAALSQDSKTDKSPTGLQGNTKLFTISKGAFALDVSVRRLVKREVDPSAKGKDDADDYVNNETVYTLQDKGEAPVFGNGADHASDVA